MKIKDRICDNIWMIISLIVFGVFIYFFIDKIKISGFELYKIVILILFFVLPLSLKTMYYYFEINRMDSFFIVLKILILKIYQIKPDIIIIIIIIIILILEYMILGSQIDYETINSNFINLYKKEIYLKNIIKKKNIKKIIKDYKKEKNLKLRLENIIINLETSVWLFCSIILPNIILIISIIFGKIKKEIWKENLYAIISIVLLHLIILFLRVHKINLYKKAIKFIEFIEEYNNNKH